MAGLRNRELKEPDELFSDSFCELEIVELFSIKVGNTKDS